METNTEKKTLQAEPAAAHDPVELLRTYGPAAGIGVAIALIISLGSIFYKNQQQSTRDRASEMLLNAQSVDHLHGVVDQYPATPSAPMALLALAAERFHEGRFDLARTHYEQFIQQYADHSMIPSAHMGLAYSMEAEGQLGAALNAFRALHDAAPNHYLAPLAKLSEARVLATMEQYAEALAIYTDYLDTHPEGAWRSQALAARVYVEKELRSRGM